jgi:hypothetical protein
VPSSPAGSAAAAASPQALSGAAALLAAGRQYVEVVCGSLHGWLDLKDCWVLVAGGQVRNVRQQPLLECTRLLSVLWYCLQVPGGACRPCKAAVPLTCLFCIDNMQLPTLQQSHSRSVFH